MTPHFSLQELRGLDAPPEAQAQLYRLMLLLERCRSLWGDRPVHITSGYRSPETNRACGGSPRSQHLTGSAADLHVADLSAREAWRMLLDSDIPVGQAIVYGVGPDGTGPGTFIHLSLPDRGRGLLDQYLWTPAAGGAAGPYYLAWRLP